jgi:hypothetical protein
MAFLTSIKAWSCWVPHAVSAVGNLPDNIFCHRAEMAFVYTGLSPFIQLMRCHYLVMYGHCKQAFGGSPFEVSPTPSQAIIPWDVKICHCPGSLKCLLCHVILVYFHFSFGLQTHQWNKHLFCFLSGDSNVFLVSFIRCCWKACSKMKYASNNPVTLLDYHALYLKHLISKNKLQMDEW